MTDHWQKKESLDKHSRITLLTLLRKEIDALRVVKCRMAHEQVVRSTDTMQPQFSQQFPNSFERVGLCSPEVRAERLGCSHTMSRTKLDRALDELDSAIAEHLRAELSRVTDEIHLLDHRKGHAEANKARIELNMRSQCEEGVNGELLKASNKINQLEQEHDEYVERVGELKERILQELEKKIMQNIR